MKRKDLSRPDPVSPAGSVLSPTARMLLAQALRPNTRRAYAAQIKGWLKWRGLSRLEPCDPIDIANYIAELSAAGRSISSLRMIVAALKAAHEAQGWRFETAHPLIGHVLRGAANAFCALPRQAEPLRGDVLLEILQSITASGPSLADLRDAALLAVGYLFALRRSELVGLDLQEQVIGDEKSWGVLRLRRTTIDIILARSKTFNGLPELVRVPRANNMEAVKAIEAWVSAAGILARQPLFWSFTKGGKLKSRLSDQTVSTIVKRRVAERPSKIRRNASPGSTPGDAGRMSGHSLRVGLVVTAAEAGADLRSIATVTRHRTLTMPARYAEQADQLRTSPHQLNGVGLKAEEENE